MSKRLWCMLFTIAFLLGLTVTQSFQVMERPEVFWPEGAETAWCYRDDSRHRDVICFAEPPLPDTWEMVPWVE